MTNVTRDEIAEYIYEEFGLTKRDCTEIVNDIIEKIIQGLIDSDFVKIHNFGTFKLKRKKSRIGRNPKTREDVMIDERNIISFKPSKKFINSLNLDLNLNEN
jgi:integration host factor subunit alpha